MARISYDGLGSVIAQNGSGGPRVMLDAHMDELGGVVRRVTDGGFLVHADAGRLAGPGAAGPTMDHHRLQGAGAGRQRASATSTTRRRRSGRRSFRATRSSWDVGAKSAADATRLGLEPGDPVVPYSPLRRSERDGQPTSARPSTTGLDARSS